MPQYVDSPLGGGGRFTVSPMMMMMVRYGMYAVLNPSLKLAYMKTHWGTEYYKHAEATIERVGYISSYSSSTCAYRAV